MTRPRLLDLFCGAGGAGMGYHRAGFDVVGVDLDPQPHYPFEFHQADALTFPLDGFDAVHASPPCQAHTPMSNRWRGAGGLADERVDLIPATRDRLEASGLPWVIENVRGADLRNSVELTGEMFGLRVHRPRLFETNWLLLSPAKPRRQRDPVAVYGQKGDGRLLWTRNDGTELRCADLATARDAMDMPWADWHGVKEAIPPAYTEFIGGQLLAVVREAVA